MVDLSDGMWHRVLATEFSDPKGYKNTNLNDGKLYYAELSTNPQDENYDHAALNDLDYKQALNIKYKGKTCVAYKGDIGRGNDIDFPAIDLHKHLAKKLGFTGKDYVEIKLA